MKSDKTSHQQKTWTNTSQSGLETDIKQHQAENGFLQRKQEQMLQCMMKRQATFTVHVLNTFEILSFYGTLYLIIARQVVIKNNNRCGLINSDNN